MRILAHKVVALSCFGLGMPSLMGAQQSDLKLEGSPSILTQEYLAARSGEGLHGFMLTGDPLLVMSSDELNDVIQQYCVGCHNDVTLRGNLSLSEFDIAKVPQLAETADCLLYTSPSPRDATLSRMPSSA